MQGKRNPESILTFDTPERRGILSNHYRTMTIKELIDKLETIKNKHGEHMEITVCDYSDDSSESFNFNKADGVEVIEGKKVKFVSIFFE